MFLIRDHLFVDLLFFFEAHAGASFEDVNALLLNDSFKDIYIIKLFMKVNIYRHVM